MPSTVLKVDQSENAEIMNTRRYQGRLYYDNSNEYLRIDNLIIREREIAFVLASVGQEHGAWLAESGKPAQLQPDDSYKVSALSATKEGVKASSLWDITFHIEYEEIGQMIELSGSISEAGSTGTFYGELKAIP